MDDLVTSRHKISSEVPAQRYAKLEFKRDIQAQDNEMKAQHNAKSPFLQLPLELKTLVYELVCGGEIIHIKKKRGLAHSLCSAEHSEEEAQTMFDISDAIYNDHNSKNRHGCCWALHYSNSRGWEKTTKFSVLACCRQMYLESKSVIYSTNTFSFSSSIVLSEFCLKTPRRSLDIIRSVQVDVAISINKHYLRGTWEWENGFETLNSSLKGLSRLHVGIRLHHDPIRGDVSYGLPAQELLLETILQAEKLDLAVATVILWDDYGRYNMVFGMALWDRMTQWTLPQKQEWSRYVTRSLLHYEDQVSDLASVQRKALEEGRICRLGVDPTARKRKMKKGANRVMFHSG